MQIWHIFIFCSYLENSIIVKCTKTLFWWYYHSTIQLKVARRWITNLITLILSTVDRLCTWPVTKTCLFQAEVAQNQHGTWHWLYALGGAPSFYRAQISGAWRSGAYSSVAQSMQSWVDVTAEHGGPPSIIQWRPTYLTILTTLI